MRTRNRIRSILLHAAIALFSVASLYPLVIVLSGSLRPPGQSAAPLNLFEQVTMSSYRVAYETMKYPLSLWNSVLLTFISVTAVVLLASAAAYPMARIQSRTSRFLAMFFLSGLIVSGQMALIPIYTVMDALQIKDGQLASILMFLTCSLPFSTFLYTGFINSSVPYELEEAAVIDGARPMRRFWTIVFPLLSPTTFFLLVVNIVYVFFDTFGIIDAVTGGGPSGATETLVYKVFSDGKGGSDLGGSAAQSVVLLVMVIAMTAIQFRFIERKVSY